MPIIRITKAQIEEANKAREAALAKNAEYRLYEERHQSRIQAALRKKIEDTNKERKTTSPNYPEHRLCDEHQRVKPEAVAREEECDS